MRALVLGAILLALAGEAVAAPPEEAIISLDRYTSPRGKSLAITFGSQLRQIYDRVYHCRPWLEVQKGGLGFTHPVGVPGDDRFLNIWVWVDQQMTPEFGALSPARRASAMFSRHGVDLLRHLAADAGLFADPTLHGYSVILTWIKPSAGGGGEAQKSETLGVFADKAAVRGFLARRIGAREFVGRATIVAFDGKERLGRLPLEIWEDNFATTFKLKDYQPENKNLRC